MTGNFDWFSKIISHLISKGNLFLRAPVKFPLNLRTAPAEPEIDRMFFCKCEGEVQIQSAEVVDEWAARNQRWTVKPATTCEMTWRFWTSQIRSYFLSTAVSQIEKCWRLLSFAPRQSASQQRTNYWKPPGADVFVCLHLCTSKLARL